MYGAVVEGTCIFNNTNFSNNTSIHVGPLICGAEAQEAAAALKDNLINALGNVVTSSFYFTEKIFNFSENIFQNKKEI